MPRTPALPTAFALAALCVAAATAQAQSSRKSRGFEQTLPATAAGEELTAQSDLWVMRVDFKPVRLARVSVTDEATGQTRQELVWYLAWRATNAPLRTPERDTSAEPRNEFDPPPGERMFVPEFLLVTEDGTQTAHYDEILPTAFGQIRRREFRGELAGVAPKNTVTAAGPLPALKDGGDAEPIYGIATWRGIDPTTDKFTVYLGGFSNGYRIEQGPDGKDRVARRTGVLQFWRPGDEFGEDEREFRVGIDPRDRGPEAETIGAPKWEYLPDEARLPDGPPAAAADAGPDA